MKDFKRLEERINEEKKITIGDITELGYSRYDINLFIEAGILSRAKRGLYQYLPEVKRVEEQPPQEEKEQVVEEQHLQAEETQSVEEQKHSAYLCVRDGVRKIMKRRGEEAIPSFEKALELEPNNSRAILGLIGAYVFLDNYEKAYTEIIRFYNTRQDNYLIYNIYYYLLLLKEHISIDENILNEIKNEIEENKDSLQKLSSTIKRYHIAIEKKDYLEALKYINYSLSFDIKKKKYHITNHIYKALIMSILKLKGIDPYEKIAKSKSTASVEETSSTEEPLVEEQQEEVIVIPATPVETTIKTNLLIEAINQNDYEKALSLLEQENIDNPLEVIKTLLTKLAMIKSLITTNEPIKVVSTEPVQVVKEESILEEIDQTVVNTTPTLESTQVLVPPSIEETIPQQEEYIPTPEELTNIAYKAYKNAYDSEQFDEATRNLRRYEYLNNQNAKHRNVNYHYIRIAKSKQDYESNPERYIKKKALAQVIFELKRDKKYQEALAAITEYKTLGGIRNDLILIYEAEIYFALKDFASVQRILSVLAKDCEEPNFFILSSKISFRSYRFQDALQYCQAFNERRPNQSPANYQLMGDCYTKLGKSGKAIKCYRKAEEIAASQGNTRLDLSTKINRQEMIAEIKKEDRDAKSLKK